MMHLDRSFLFLISFLLLLGCKEEKLPPSLEVHSPSPTFSGEPGDTLILDIEASSDHGLDQLHISLVGSFHKNRYSFKRYDLGGVKELRKDFAFPVGSSVGQGYGHQLRVMVETEKGTKRRESIPGRISEDPETFDKAFVVLRPTSQKVDVDSFRTQQEGVQDFLNLTMDLSGSGVSSLHQELYVAGAETGDLIAYDPHDGSVRWNEPNQGGGLNPYFLDLFEDREEEWIIASLGTERLKGFRGGSGPAFTANALNGYLIREAIKVQDRLLTEQEPISSADPRKWVTYYASTGSVGTEKEIPDRDIVRILEGDAGDARVLANENGQGKFFRYDVEDRIFHQLAPLPSGKLHDGLRLSNGRTLLVHDQGLFLDQEGSDIYQAIDGSVPQAIAYDRIGGRLFIGVGQDLRILDASTGNLQWEHSYSDSIKGVHVLYDE